MLLFEHLLITLSSCKSQMLQPERNSKVIFFFGTGDGVAGRCERKQSHGKATRKEQLNEAYLNENNDLSPISPEFQHAVHHTREAGAGVLDPTMNDSTP